MQIKINKNSDYINIELDGDLTIYNAASVKEQLLPLFLQTENIEINLSQVKDLDSAGIQLLILAKREISNDGRELRLTAHSRAVLEIFELYNLAAYFGDPVLISNSTNDRLDTRGSL